MTGTLWILLLSLATVGALSTLLAFDMFQCAFKQHKTGFRELLIPLAVTSVGFFALGAFAGLLIF